jgi:hypothetical protein
MRTLAESLSEYGEVMLRAIAGQWGVAPETDPADLPLHLAAVLLDRECLRTFIAALDAPARSALAQVAAGGGSVRGHLLTHAYGELRRLGPRAVEREEPWQHPASAVERLYYAGLLFRRHGEVFYIPSDLLAALPPLRASQGGVTLSEVPEPSEARDEGDALAFDLEVFLARLRLDPVPVRRRGELPVAFLASLSARWRGARDPERLSLLLRLAQRAHLVTRRGEMWQVNPGARSWLQQVPYRRQQSLFDAWQGDSGWNELWRIPSLRCEDTGWRNDPLVARQAVLGMLRRLPAGWVRLADLVAALKATQPDFARPDGDYDSWYIRDAATGQYLSGFAHWEAVEGALIRHLVTRELFWLGALELGERGEVLRLTATGRAFLRLSAPPVAPPAAPIQIQDDLTLRVPRHANAYDRVRLERLARWQGRQGEDDLYCLEMETIWQAHNAGITPRQIAAFLQRVSGGPLPAGARRSLRAWAERLGQVSLQRAVLLQTTNAEALRQLRRDAELAQRLGVVVSERAVLVPEEQVAPVLARLKTLGWWPRLMPGLSPLLGSSEEPVRRSAS